MPNDPKSATWLERHGRDVLLLVLTWAAGANDAIGYLMLGHVLTANMTGNTVLLGLHLGQEQGLAALRSLVAFIGFGAGLVIGAMIVERRRHTGPWPLPITQALALEAVMLAGFALGVYHIRLEHPVSEEYVLILVSAVAMGIQSAAVRRLNVPGIATTYVTGTMTNAITGLVAGSGSGNPSKVAGAPVHGAWWRPVRLQILALVVYGFGAMVAGVGHLRWTTIVAALPFAGVAFVVAAAPRWGGR